MLALETSSMTCSVAALERGHVVFQEDSPLGTRTTQALAPMIVNVLAAAGWKSKEIESVAVTSGPGSFTGLRIGVTTAKTLAYATGATVVGVNTLDVIAAQTPVESKKLWVLLDAQRQQLFARCYEAKDSNTYLPIDRTSVVDQSSLLALLGPGDAVTGRGISSLVGNLPSTVVTVDETKWNPVAATVAEVANRKLADSGPDDLWSLVPEYYRKSAAEEKLGR